MIDLGPTALGSWSGGRSMHFGVAVDEQRLARLLTPDDAIRTVVTADVYGEGAADRLVGRALAGRDRGSYDLVGTVGHDFYSGVRDGSKGFPRFTDRRLRGQHGYYDYLRMATERSLERCGVDRFDVLLLHNPDRVGYSSEVVWAAMTRLRDERLTRGLGIAPGPANGFTLDVIGCVERFGPVIDWAMLILNPLEPWPGRLALPACDRHDVRVLARVVDYGGLFHDALEREDALPERDHRAFRPAGWVAAGREKIEALRPIAQRHGLTMLQLACAWTLAQPAVASVVPTLIQEAGDAAKPIEQERAELAAVTARVVLSVEELETITRIGDNTGSMALKGGSAVYSGEPLADQWPLAEDLIDTAARWGIVPERDLVKAG
jgi:aryl-alcohol dehydrogenase-like predicted oxidoreductase